MARGYVTGHRSAPDQANTPKESRSVSLYQRPARSFQREVSAPSGHPTSPMIPLTPFARTQSLNEVSSAIARKVRASRSHGTGPAEPQLTAPSARAAVTSCVIVLRCRRSTYGPTLRTTIWLLPDPQLATAVECVSASRTVPLVWRDVRMMSLLMT